MFIESTKHFVTPVVSGGSHVFFISRSFPKKKGAKKVRHHAVRMLLEDICSPIASSQVTKVPHHGRAKDVG